MAPECYRTPDDLTAAARTLQKELAAALPPDLRLLPRWKLAQDKHIPTITELRERLTSGGGDLA